MIGRLRLRRSRRLGWEWGLESEIGGQRHVEGRVDKGVLRETEAVLLESAKGKISISYTNRTV